MVKSYSSILVPLDGSEYSKRASLDEAIEISKRLDSEIELLAAVTASAAQPAEYLSQVQPRQRCHQSNG